MTNFPCPVPPKPATARQHCKHYSYKGGLFKGGPKCAVGVDNSNNTLPCMPPTYQKGECIKREEWSDAEREEYEKWSKHHRERLICVMEAIPKDKAKSDYWQGFILCPACGAGTVHYNRARSNHHLWASCTTPNCFAIIQ